MTCTKHNTGRSSAPPCLFCLAEASGQTIPPDRFDPNPMPWTKRPLKVYTYKYPVGQVFTPIAPEGTLMLETNDEDLARLDNMLMKMFSEPEL